MNDPNRPRLRSEIWFNDTKDPGETAIYIERFSNYGITREELQSARPIIGIAQSGSDVVPCNRIHMSIVDRVKAGIRDAGGVPMEFRPIRCRKALAVRPPLWIATSHILAW